MGQVIRRRVIEVGSGNFSAGYTYLANSPLIQQVVFKDGTTTRMTTTKSYDYINRLLSISSTAGSANISSHAYTYNDANQRTRAQLGDGSYWIYEYDKLGQVISGKRYWADGTLVPGQQHEYAFDDIGNRTTAKTGGDTSGQNLRSSSYTANNLNQYSSRTVPGYVQSMGIANPSATVTVNGQSAWRKGEFYQSELSVVNTSAAQYPSITNRAVLSGTTNTSIGSLFLAQTAESLSYDSDGNVTGDGRWVHTWDGENRLVAMESLSSNPTASKRKVEYTYDHQSRLIRRKSYNGPGGSYVVSTDTKWIYDGWRQLAELNATNNLLVRGFTWGLDLSGSLEKAGGIGGLLMFTDGGTSTTHFYAYDGNGNVMALVKATDGTKSADYEYGPFGEVIRISGSAAKANPFRFSTKCQDEETELVYYGYRFYNAAIGRWVNRDPIGERGGVNAYAAFDNRPISAIDLYGLLSAFFEIVTYIKTDFYILTSGQKSYHWVKVDLDKPQITSTTHNLGFTHSIQGGGSFSERVYSFPTAGVGGLSSYTVFLDMIGEAYTRVPGPHIDYNVTFEIKVDRDPCPRISLVRLRGAHDGFPSYKMRFGRTRPYEHTEGIIFELSGDSDIAVDVELWPRYRDFLDPLPDWP